jgi:hypothetical protein
MQLTDQHVTLLMLADAFVLSGDPLDLDALRITWDDHRAEEREGLELLAAALGIQDAVLIGRVLDVAVEALLALDAADPKELRGAVAGHVDGYEYEVFSQLVMAADPSEMEGAARRARAVRVM